MSLRWIPVLVLLAAAAGFAQDAQSPSAGDGYSSPRVDFGIVVSDIEKAKEFYEQALGLKEVRNFTVPGDFAKSVGLTNNLPFTVHVMQISDGPKATQVKLMQFDGTRPSRQDLAYIHSTYGVSYLTFYVSDLKAALERAAEHGVKPIAQGPKQIDQKIAPGTGIALVRDPDGNLIELVGPMEE